MTTFVCEWCSPSTELATEFVAKHPEKCVVSWCPNCQCRTWHAPSEELMPSCNPTPSPPTILAEGPNAKKDF
jgi:hypothetical protein